ncbi:MAG: IS66 family transposase [Chloroflexi bacterium]|nr:IS66 family transposase [Chloroflexota bacterium]
MAAEREHYRELYLKAMEQCRKLELGILGPKKERLGEPETQLTMALLAELLGRAASPVSTPTQQVREHTRAKPTGRKPLPEHLPRVEVEIVPPEVERDGRDAYEVIGEDVSETVERRPASMVVVKVRRPKFVRKDRERLAETEVLVAAPPELPIERGLAGPAMLADTIVRRWQDHLPLYRLEQIYAREGLELARSTICGWHAALAELARPLVDAMWTDARGAPYLCTDATGVLVQAEEECRRGHFWVVVAPRRHVLYAYTPQHDGAAVDELLAGYEGFLVADAHSVYDHLYKTGKVFEVGCWAHLRRYFYKALDSELDKAREALALIGEIFRIERTLGDVRPDERLAVRQRVVRPVVERFFAWCQAQVPTALDDTPLKKGLTYATNQKKALERFLTDGRLPVHNNASENALRREVLGRKNWIFLGNDDAGDVNAAFVTLLASCQLHGIEPWAYLRDLFCLLPSWPQKRVLELAPVHWKQTLEKDDAQQRLAANVFRRALLGLDQHPQSK